MAVNNDQTQLVGNFKDVWGSNIIELFKFMAPLTNMVPFESSELVGGKFHQPVDLQQEHGFTSAASGSTPTLLAPVAGYLGDAQVEGSQLYGRSRVTYEAIMRSASDRQAVKQATAHVVKRLGRSGAKRMEIQFLHGRRGIGTLGSLAAQGGAGPYTRVLTVSDDSWASGIWAGMENATLDLYDTTLVTKRNATEKLTVNSVDMAAKTITVGYATNNLITTGAATDVLFFETASATSEMAGLDVISRNTGTLFNVNAATYALWGGNVYSNSTGTLSMAKILEALSIPASFGLMGMRAVCVVSPKAFEVLNSDQAALRQYDASYRAASVENGTAGILYHSQVGELEILPHPFQKDGLAHIFVPDETKRIGASDFGFVVRGGNNPQLILESADAPASEMRTQSHQALFVECPRHTVVMGGITY